MIQPAPGGIIVTVRVIARAGRSGIDGTRDGALLVRVNAPPVEGAANDAVVRVVAGALGVPARDVTIASGARGRLKRLRIAGVTSGEAGARLQALTT